MAKRAEYKIIVGSNGFNDFENQVSNMMNKGWKPVGGIAFNSGFANQAMARIVDLDISQKPTEKTTKKDQAKPMDTAEAMRMIERGI